MKVVHVYQMLNNGVMKGMQRERQDFARIQSHTWFRFFFLSLLRASNDGGEDKEAFHAAT